VRTGVVGVTFAIYKEQEGGAALWLETQNVGLDEQGRYTVLLGATKSEGLPLELFLGGETRWLGAQVQLPGEVEQGRVLLLSVPYALKAADAETLGGKPASAFVTTEQAGLGGTTVKGNASVGLVSLALGGGGSANVVSKFDGTGTNVINSSITDDGTNVNTPENVGALAYKFTGNATPPTDPTATIFNQANVGPVFSGLSFKVRTGVPTPADALTVDASHNTSLTGNASALAYKFTGNATPPTDPTATIFNQANVGPVFSGLSFKVRTGAPAPADALSIDPSQNVSVVRGNLMLSGAGNAIVFSDGTVQSTAVKGTGGGTITGVTAGAGLTGGGTAGSVALSNTGVLSFNGRSGLVSPSTSDYSFTQIGGAATTAQLPAASLVRAITYLAGCDSCSILTTADSQNTIFVNLIGGMTINSVTCFSDAGGPTVNIQNNHTGTLTNVLSTNLTCSTAGATSSSFSTSALSLNDSLNFVMATVDGVAKRVTVTIKAIVN
jgi:hypothetical protein